jgi:hypothetical protein
LKTVKELEVIAEEANKSFDVMDLGKFSSFLVRIAWLTTL